MFILNSMIILNDKIYLVISLFVLFLYVHILPAFHMCFTKRNFKGSYARLYKFHKLDEQYVQ